MKRYESSDLSLYSFLMFYSLKCFLINLCLYRQVIVLDLMRDSRFCPPKVTSGYVTSSLLPWCFNSAAFYYNLAIGNYVILVLNLLGAAQQAK